MRSAVQTRKCQPTADAQALNQTKRCDVAPPEPDPEVRGNDRPAPLTLSADQDTEEQLRALDEGSAEHVATDDAALQIGDPATAPPESPARAAQQRAGRSSPA